MNHIDINIHCPLCKSESIKPWLIYDYDVSIVKCEECTGGFVWPFIDVSGDYEDYGSYITGLSDEYFDERLKISIYKKLFFWGLKLFFSRQSAILDFGGGAGFFAKSCIVMGFKNTYVFEPSKKFREAAKNRVGIPGENLFGTMEDVKSEHFDVVTMLDVIEHLPEKEIHHIISNLASRMSPGAVLFGETPNASSFNIWLHGIKDPVISPPGHLFYFTKKSLHKLLTEHGFKRILLVTKGFNTNSFFRSKKFEPSWVEMPNNSQKLLSKIVRLAFGFINIPVSVFGLGYHLVFVYQLKK